jgi:hypothetical protein
MNPFGFRAPNFAALIVPKSRLPAKAVDSSIAGTIVRSFVKTPIQTEPSNRYA